MIIGGLEKLTLIDYPDHLAAIVFTQGCNFRCHYCYNPMLVLSQKELDKRNKKEEGFSTIPEQDLFLFLKERFGRLDGVVITGGEPTLHPDLESFIKKIKDIGYDVKLDSNGTNPEALQNLIDKKLIDYIAMDIKAPLDKYKDIVGVNVDCDKLQKSVNIIKRSNVPYEFRTTVVPNLLVKNDFDKMGKMIEGADKWYLQKFKSDVSLVNTKYQQQEAYRDTEMEEFANIGQKYVKHCQVR